MKVWAGPVFTIHLRGVGGACVCVWRRRDVCVCVAAGGCVFVSEGCVFVSEGGVCVRAEPNTLPGILVGDHPVLSAEDTKS